MLLIKMSFCKVIFLYIFFITSDAKEAAKFGPYKAVVVSVTNCKRPVIEDKHSFIHVFTELYNTTTKPLLRGNVTVFKENRHIKVKSKRFLWEDGQWNVNFVMNNIGCHGLIMQLICTSTGVKYDRETCSLHKGTYLFEDLDADKQLHMWTDTMEYGRMLWKFQMYSQAGTACCVEFEFIMSKV